MAINTVLLDDIRDRLLALHMANPDWSDCLVAVAVSFGLHEAAGIIQAHTGRKEAIPPEQVPAGGVVDEDHAP